MLCTLPLTPAAHGAPPSQATLFSDNFDDGNASGWSTSGGSWSVVSDGSPVYSQSSISSDAKASAGSSGWTSQAVEARVKPVAFNGANRFAAVLARFVNSTNYYYLALRSNNTVELGKRVSGGYTPLATAPFTVSTGTWYTVRLQASGTALTGSVNGAVLVSASDSAFASGKAGLAAFNTSARFDDVLVTGAGTGPTPSGTPTRTNTPVGPTATRTNTPTLTQPGPTNTPTRTSTATATAVGPTRTPTSTATAIGPTSTPTRTPTQGPTQPVDTSLVGFAAVNALGQNGTTGGAGGPTVVVDTTEELLTAIDTIGPMIIRVQGTINITSKQGVRPNKSIIGVGTTAVINGGGLDFYRSFNVIVRNIRFTNAEDDAVNVGQNSHHIWIDHNEFETPVDGAIDIVRGAEYVTVSWNWFRGTDKSMLIGHSDSNGSEDTGHLKVTIHHNYFDGSNQRHPRVRFGEPVHVYNNYYRNNGLYGVATTENAGVMVEGNYFENVAFPILVGYAESGPGRVVQRNNIFVNSGTPQTAGTVVEPGTFYSYTLDNPANVPNIVRNGAGVGKIGQ